VTAIFFALGLAIGAWAIAIPLMKALFDLSDASLSLALFAAGAGAIAAMPVAGLLPPGMGGTGPVLRVSGPILAALLAALPLMHVLSTGIAPLALCAFLFGVFNNILVDVPMNAHASVVETRWGRPIMSSFHAAWSGGGLVGAVFGGLLISRGRALPSSSGSRLW
jgi:predicted MFS family arabinose efflux permease